MDTTIPITNAIALCDDLRAQAPKQTTLTVRYLLAIARNPGKTADAYHRSAIGKSQYSHGNTVLKVLYDLGYIELEEPLSPSSGIPRLTPKAKSMLGLKAAQNSSEDCIEALNPISVIRLEDRILVKAPYHPALPPQAAEIGGKWIGEKSSWEYSLGREPDVRRLYERIHGEYVTPTARVSITCKGPLRDFCDEGSTPQKSIFIAGIIIAKASQGARLWLSRQATVTQGALYIGDDREVIGTENTVIKISGVREPLAQALVAKCSPRVVINL